MLLAQRTHFKDLISREKEMREDLK